MKLLPTTTLSPSERARKSLAQEQATNHDFEQTPGFRKSLRPPSQRWGRGDCSRIALGHLVLLAFSSTASANDREGELPRPPAQASPSQSSPTRLIRPLLQHFAEQERLRRSGEGAVGLASAGALFGVGFAAEAPDMTWSHALWVASGIVGVGSLVHLFVPSALETLAGQSNQLSDDELTLRWRSIARAARTERLTGAVLGSLFGATSITLGALVLEGELGDLEDDQRLILGSTLVAGGAVGAVESAVHWFVPTPVETGYRLSERSQRLNLSALATPSGFFVGVSGGF